MNQYNQIVPPPPPPMYRKTFSYGRKIFQMGLMCCALMIGVLAIWIMSYSRERSSKNVAESIVSQWGESVYITGPTAKTDFNYVEQVRPLKFDCQAEVDTKSLHRGIYEAEVFNAKVSMAGSFDKESLRALGDTVLLELDVTTKQIVKLNPLKIGGKEIAWQKKNDCLYAKVGLSGLPKTIEFSTGFEVRGSASLFVNQIGEESTIAINGSASNPSFTGSSLPLERTSKSGSFDAKWEVAVPEDIASEEETDFVGTNFLVGVDRYRKVARSLKYSFFIILLTFISVLFVEIMRRQPIPLLNYFLIGGALVIFYSLLLSFVELVSFGCAYQIASAMTVVLITGYMWKMLRSRTLGLSIGGVLSLMYLFCYIMLSLSTYALLFGSLLLFLSLAAMMYASLKLKTPPAQ